MNSLISKVVAAGFALVGVGTVFSEGGISSSSKDLLLPIFKSSNSNTITPLQGSCKIWEVEIKRGSYDVTKVIREIENRDELVNNSDPANAKFVSEVRDACAGRKDGRIKINNHIYIYVYRQNGKWVYSYKVQKHDWHRERGGITDPYRNT
ncbi:hypothetical protein MHC_02255 [Mycoplasma haemocanis str. Illinois]|uniref:Uncharacterized protein n=1 Tax=Mycoplasma haemocanis (strain Illinois) TaxID=1111676 RepID=H6N6P5_MYCHN|nr:hypothetical protein [Mycoplasma haemocanis]AEW45317.1 hypothetical protein MHC_02255 [Mycoplasma haemocanis str. Illinois]